MQFDDLDPAALPAELYEALESAVELREPDRGRSFDAIAEHNPEWRRHIELFLRAANADSGQFDELIQPYYCSSEPSSSPPDIREHTILHLLGEGGMGVVYLAEKGPPLNLRIAIKVIKAGMDSERILRRFESERLLLARLDHPYIARIADAGTCTDGRPWFSMEYVDGAPITGFCDERQLDIRQRIRLFLKVCEAVRYAHGREVIHRDIKPGNVMVSMTADGPVPKVIDFGLAKVIDQDGADGDITETGARVGTLAYMAPEQLWPSGGEVTEQTDVYLLGAVLHELLVGSRPSDHSAQAGSLDRRLHQASLCVVPSALEVAADRGTSPAKLRSSLRGPLDRILARALEREQARRYAAVDEFAGDLQAFLDDRPVAAPRLPVLAGAFGGLGSALLLVGLSVAAAVLLLAWSSPAAAEGKPPIPAVLQASAKALEEQVDALYPAWPENDPVREQWLKRVEELAGAVRSQLEQIRACAQPSGEVAQEESRRQNDGFEALELLRAKHRFRRRVVAIANGDGRRPQHKLTREQELLVDSKKAARAIELIGPRRRVYGREAEGLALALSAMENEADPTAEQLSTLGWAYMANGQFYLAQASFRKCIEIAPSEVVRAQATRQQMLLHAAMVQLNDPLVLARYDNELLDREGGAVKWQWATAKDREQAAVLEQLLTRVRQLERIASDIREGLVWSGVVARLTQAHPNAGASWAEAREAIYSADGVTANKAYAGFPALLKPQTGLVPIGMNPQTLLWEFYHLRTATSVHEVDPEDLRIPRHLPDGTIRVDSFQGIVFVLLPGDRWSGVRPFFVARHELTQGQWRRLTHGNPSHYSYPNLLKSQMIRSSHPVENVSWDGARATLHRFALELPTGDEWEYFARGGSATKWHCGDRVAGLQAFANLLDQRADDSWLGERVGWDDSHLVHAPVGSFAANDFGLHDLHGNVWELCEDGLAPELSMIRGGSFRSPAMDAAIAWFKQLPHAEGSAEVGVRPIRRLSPSSFRR